MLKGSPMRSRKWSKETKKIKCERKEGRLQTEGESESESKGEFQDGGWNYLILS